MSLSLGNSREQASANTAASVPSSPSAAKPKKARSPLPTPPGSAKSATSSAGTPSATPKPVRFSFDSPASSSTSGGSSLRTPAGSPPAAGHTSSQSASVSSGSPVPSYRASQNDYAHVRGHAPSSPAGGLAPSPKSYAAPAANHWTQAARAQHAPSGTPGAKQNASLLSRLKSGVQGLLANRGRLFMACIVGATLMVLLALALSNPTLILFGVMMMTIGICGLVSQDQHAGPIAPPQVTPPADKAKASAADADGAAADELRARREQAEQEGLHADEKRRATEPTVTASGRLLHHDDAASVASSSTDSAPSRPPSPASSLASSSAVAGPSRPLSPSPSLNSIESLAETEPPSRS